jgi:hypothetical protein
VLRIAWTLQLAVPLLGLSLCGCATYRSELYRGQRYYEENRYEAALALWRALEANQNSLTPSERVRYAYLRGMTDYRLGYRPDARYWLSLAQVGEQLQPSSLGAEAKGRLEETLQELNADVLGTERSAEDVPVAGSPPVVDGHSKPPTDDPVGSSCAWSSECPEGKFCQDGACVEL